ncbi:Pyridine nucleotide-disulfide oxidoreductase class-II [Penicillium robsamsonii]|uniref:Pyridine nucleotide-disulfide oxidoreductase class-II n=1 Tax=Penicillium robsamsonii TaxID=1792511 RepID=UPI002549A8D9|nr:Pyridine nucleotide-disulfide oxidoreductase class-II [Penicillium robsamsonii]KAJ5823873.1 Pyridine nucleotide-disulfide oxidoreductase class-II [Penicillium robsamsonii]
MTSPDVIVIGAGPSGIALAYTLKHKLGFNDFTFYDKLDGPGGTWRQNTYPGVGCDVPTLLYSFSFNQNPDWSKELCEGSEILDYMEATVDKFDLRKHMQFGVECISASWNSQGFWEAQLLDIKTQVRYTRTATVFISAVGGISKPRDIKFPGMETFNGEVFHTARWKHEFDYHGKRLAVIGNGCSAAQVVPAIAKNAGSVKQYARSAQWYHERPNRKFTSFENWCMRNIPLWERYLRLRLFLSSDSLVATYLPGPAAENMRAKAERGARQYIYQTAPKKYHQILVPDFPLAFYQGCKRRIFDPNYLESLHRSNVELAPVGIDHIDETGITGTDGVRTEFDAIVLATGFDVQQFVVPMEVYGKDGKSLSQQWLESRGAQAYMGVYVHNFPNFGLLFGPNTFPAHNSVLFASEVQVDYLARTLLAPIIDHRIYSLEVKPTVEYQWVNALQTELKGSVFEAGCSNWYINTHGRNSASWPGYASTYWKETLKSQVGVFKTVPRSKIWMLNTMWRWIRSTKKDTYGMLLVALVGLLWHQKVSLVHQLPHIY